MGESKRRQAQDAKWQRVVDISMAASKVFADEGKLIEAGWAAFQAIMLAGGVPPDQRELLRNAFFSGAQHTFHSIMGVLDAGEEITASDLRRMDLVDKELTTFYDQMKLLLIDKAQGMS
jgi:hypothetical protein